MQILGLERAGNMDAGWMLVGFLREEFFLFFLQRRYETALCSSFLITVLLEDKARHALCAAPENSQTHTNSHIHIYRTQVQA